MSSDNDTSPAGRFLGIPIPASAKRLDLQVHGLDVEQTREIALRAALRGLTIKIRHLPSCDTLSITDNSGLELCVYAEQDSLVVEADESAAVEVGPSAEVQFQQECSESMAQAGVVNEALS